MTRQRPEENPLFIEHMKEHSCIAERYAVLLSDPDRADADVVAFVDEITERARLGQLFPIELVDSNPDWPHIYELEAARLKAALPEETAVRIEHYGSTAIPGISAKDIVDILIEVTDFDAAENGCVPILEEMGYAWNWYNGHIALFKGYQDDTQRFHIHMAPGDHPLMDGLLFRDYLRDHPEEARKYEELKRDLAKRFRRDREEYTAGKTKFVREIIQKAGVGQAAR